MSATTTRRRFIVPTQLAGVRLDRALSVLAGDTSRSECARWIDEGHVRVDGARLEKSAEKVRAGATIEVDVPAPPTSDAIADPSVVFTIVHEDDALLVVDKPAGLVVHPAKGHATGTLVNGLLARGFVAHGLVAPTENTRAIERTARDEDEGIADDLDETIDANEAIDANVATRSSSDDRLRPGIVHRIDKDTSGLLVVAKTAAAREALKAQFAAHSIERIYDAIAVGAIADRVTYRTLHGRHPTDRKAFSSRVREGKRAITHVNVVERFADGGVARVECRLETGRTHQIRVHLADANAPLLGDRLYGKPPRDPRVRAIAERLGRQALHARVLGFVHPTTGRAMRFEAAWPRDFEEAIDALRAIEPPPKPVRGGRAS